MHWLVYVHNLHCSLSCSGHLQKVRLWNSFLYNIPGCFILKPLDNFFADPMPGGSGVEGGGSRVEKGTGMCHEMGYLF